MDADTKVVVDTLWVVLTACLVFFMNRGIRNVGNGPVSGKERRQHSGEELYRVRHFVDSVLGRGFWFDVWQPTAAACLE